jgi:hypothetical protein
MPCLEFAEFVLMRLSQSSSISTGRTFSAGNEPTMLDLALGDDEFGPDTMNSGAPMTDNFS